MRGSQTAEKETDFVSRISALSVKFSNDIRQWGVHQTLRRAWDVARERGWALRVRLSIGKHKCKKWMADRVNYFYCMLTGKVYFGIVHVAAQGLPHRHVSMRALIASECNTRQVEHFKVVEIGSWAGQSALLWAESIERNNSRKGLVVCVDPWLPFEMLRRQPRGWPYTQMRRSIARGKVYKLFCHNVRASGFQDMVIPLQGSSHQMLPLLRKSAFDLVYVDGDHRYESVLTDLALSSQLVKEGGILCGDDLELQLHEVDRDSHAEGLRRVLDFIPDPVAGVSYHPGVTQAVGEYFDTPVTMWHGFWAMRKSGESWSRVKIPGVDSPE